MPFTYAAITGNNGAENPGGIGTYVYYAPTSDFITIQQPATLPAASTAAEAAEVTANHVFASGKKFHKFYCTQKKGKGSHDNTAEIDASGGFSNLDLFVPGVDPTVQGLLRKMKAEDGLVFLVPMADGKMLQLGITDFPAKLENFKFGTADNGGGVRGTDVKVTAFQMSPIIYSGTVQLTPAP